MTLDKRAKIYVAGDLGMAGFAIVRRLRAGSYENLVSCRARNWICSTRPRFVRICSASGVGIGTDLSIRELVEVIMQVVGFSGEVVFDTSKPDGTPRKLLDVTRLKALGWTAKTDLLSGVRSTYEDLRLTLR